MRPGQNDGRVPEYDEGVAPVEWDMTHPTPDVRRAQVHFGEQGGTSPRGSLF